MAVCLLFLLFRSALFGAAVPIVPPLQPLLCDPIGLARERSVLPRQQAERRRDAAGIQDQVGMAGHRAFRSPGRARRTEDRGQQGMFDHITQTGVLQVAGDLALLDQAIDRDDDRAGLDDPEVGKHESAMFEQWSAMQSPRAIPVPARPAATRPAAASTAATDHSQWVP